MMVGASTKLTGRPFLFFFVRLPGHADPRGFLLAVWFNIFLFLFLSSLKRDPVSAKSQLL